MLIQHRLPGIIGFPIFRLLFVLGIILVFSPVRTHGQTGIDIQTFPDPTCLGNSVTLTAIVTSTDYGSDSYTFQVIPYAPLDTTIGSPIDPLLIHCSSTNGGTDDCWGGPVTIGFNFCFFSQMYTKIFVGSNGWIGFRSPGTNNWNTYVARFIPDNAADSASPKDCIFAPWQDWLPTLNAINNVFYYTTGTAPNRELVVYWKNCPMFSCTTTKGTFQIVLKEQGGVIENHLLVKPSCAWQGNKATQGVQNDKGTIAFTATVGGTNRNNTSWTANQESMRFVPVGVSWHSSSSTGPVIGYGDTVTFSPTVPTWVYAVINTCLGVVHYDSVLVHVVPTLTGPVSVCQGTAWTYHTEPGMTNYNWSVSAGGAITGGGAGTDSTITITWNGTGNQTVGVLFTNPVVGCTATIYKILDVFVKTAPLPVLAGSQYLCLNTPGHVYTTQSGKSGYIWTVTGGTVSAGGGTADATCTITWTATGTQSVSVLYTDPGTQCTALAPTVLNVTVNPLPAPSFLAGATVACQGIPENVYSTQTGQTNYVWNISGGTITGGGGSSSSSATVTWTTAGTQTANINYSDPLTNCTAPAPTSLNVTVNPFPTPSFLSGETQVCAGVPGKLYSTQPGKSGYTWTITGGSVTSGGGPGDATMTVTWTTPGLQSASVSYSDPVTLCPALAPAVLNVYVNPLPAPSFILGETQVCTGIPGKIYTTQPGRINYAWTVTGGTITGGGGTANSTATVTWTTVGTQSISVNYTDPATLCTAQAATVLPVTVNPLPTPSFISGPVLACAGNPGQVYTTQGGMTGYIWNITGGSITGGGGTGSSTATVTWTSPGAQTISVNYSFPATQCTAAAPIVLPVQVVPLPVASVTGPSIICLNTPQGSYLTQGSMNGYSWTITPPASGTILSGGTTNNVLIQWLLPGTHTVKASYSDANGCTVATPAQQTVIVTAIPNSAISTPPGVVCSTRAYSYQTPPDVACTFTWSVIPGSSGNITSGQGTNSININWLTEGNATLHVIGSNNSYPCTSASSMAVDVKPTPVPSFVPCFDTKTTLNSKKITLRGASPFIPGQGIFSGPGVTSPSPGVYEFNPFAAGPGNNPITYTFTNNYGCSAAAASISIQVQMVSFTCGNTLTDVRDGKTYPTSLFNGQCWMTRNLDYGSPVPGLNPAPQTDNCLAEKYCQTSDATCSAYGGFYQWDEIMQYANTPGIKGLCPPEWHIPSEAEWQALIDNVMPGVTAPDANGLAGSRLKDIVAAGGFHGLLAGLYYLDNTWAFTSLPLTGTMFWTSTSSGADKAIARGLDVFNPSISWYPNSRGNAYPVRCVKD